MFDVTVQVGDNEMVIKTWMLPFGLLISLLTGVSSAFANGDAVEIFRGEEGSYGIIVRILPKDPVVGIIHFSVTPLDAQSSLPVTDAIIVIVANNQLGEPSYQVRALNTPASAQDYEANITFESAGTWTLMVEVRSDSLGRAIFAVPVNLEEQPVGPGSVGAIVFLGVFMVLVGGGVYVYYSARRQASSSSS